MGKPEYQCSKSAFAYYKRRVKAWLSYFGIKARALYFEHKKSELEYAWFYNDEGNEGAMFGLSTSFYGLSNDDIRNEGGIQRFIDKCAFHEVLECLFVELREMASSEDEIDEGQVDANFHKVLSTLENTAFYDLRESV